MEKIFNQKNFNNFVWSPLGSRGNIYINFCLQVYFNVSAAWYCSHYLPPLSMTPVANCHRCQKYKGNWLQNLPPVSFKPVANLPPVSLIPEAICHRCHWHRWQICHRVVDLDLRISPRIFDKIRNDPNVIIRGLGEGDSWKKPEAKNLVTLSL